MDIDINYIIQQSIKGDKFYQEILLKELKPLILKNIKKYCKVNDTIVEDLIQEGYIVILESFKKYDDRSNVHFLRFVQINIIFFYKNYFRDSFKEPEILSLNQKLNIKDETVELGELIKSKRDRIDSLFKKFEIKELYSCISKLSEKEQEVLFMYYEEKLSLIEISKSLNIPYRTALGRKQTAIKKLRKMMKINNRGNRN